MRRSILLCVVATIAIAFTQFAAAVDNSKPKKKTVADCEFDFANCYFRCERVGMTDTSPKAPKRVRNCKSSCRTKRDMCIRGASDFDGTVSPPPARTFTPRSGVIGPRNNILDSGPGTGNSGPAPTGPGRGSAPPSGQIK
jgi:hypothetical protein